MQYRPLGSTGFMTSAMGLGGESALTRRSDLAVQIIAEALNWGINYFDTAPLYGDSELNFGDVLPHRRAEMFIATKTDQRTYDAAWRQFEHSLTRLRVDSVDLLQIHHLGEMEEVEQIFAQNGALRMLWEAKEQGLTKFVGVTGHRDPRVLLSAIESFDFDTILMALNPAEVHIRSFQDKLLPRAVEKGMGVMAMKVLARGLLHSLADIPVPDAIGYALSLPVSNAVLGVMGLGQLQRDVRIVNAFQPMKPARMARLEALAEDEARRINFYRRGGSGEFPEVEKMERRAL